MRTERKKETKKGWGEFGKRSEHCVMKIRDFPPQLRRTDMPPPWHQPVARTLQTRIGGGTNLRAGDAHTAGGKDRKPPPSADDDDARMTPMGAAKA